MASYSPQSQQIGEPQQERRTYTKPPQHNLFNNKCANSTISKADDSSPLPPAQALNSALEAYRLCKRSSRPGEKPTWACAERIETPYSRDKLQDMILERGLEVSPEIQYRTLEPSRRMHITQLIKDRSRAFPNVEWTCAYAKEHKRSTIVPHNGKYTEEIFAMDVILLIRTRSNRRYPLTPIGELVDLREGDSPDSHS